jgi:hypothetical protein
MRRPAITALLLSLAAVAFVAAAALALSSCKKSDTPSRPKCQVHADCTNGACYLGACYPTASCIDRKDCNSVPVCQGMRCICTEDTNRCAPVCITDDDCAKTGQCVNGICTTYTASFTGMTPPSTDRGALKVGVARADLDFPMGVSMAGYASRTGPRTPYQDQLGGSNAWHDKPDVRAIAFDDGKEMFVLLRLPLAWSTDEIVTDVARKVLAKRGVDLLGHIITSAPHSHSQPARFWHLVKGFGFGYFGYDEFNFEIFDRLTTSFADAVMMALDARQPARFGYAILDGVDPDSKIHRDRRHENDMLPDWLQRDDRLVLMRIDDMNGKPIAVLVQLGIHGTVYDQTNPILTADAPGGIEMELYHHASAKYGREVLGVFLQGNAGDISPAGDDLQHNNAERIQLIGERTWKVIEPAIEAITTSADTEVGVITGRVPISHEILGYKSGEFHDVSVMCENSPPYFRYGAFQCVAGMAPPGGFQDGNLECIFAVECLTNGYPIPQFQKTNLAVFRLGALAFATMPGEPLSQFGRTLGDRIKAQIPGINDAATLGYSMDHHFYLMNELDWRQGGYEPSRDIWGWRMADYFADRAVDLAKELAKPPEQRTWDEGNLKPMVWDDPPADKAPIMPNETEGSPDEVLVDVPQNVERLDLVELAWRGGHPGVDRPHVVLEVESGQMFQPVKRDGGLVYDDSGFNFMVHYDGVCGPAMCTQHKWRITWEETRDFPTGTYRFTIEGQAYKSGAMIPYTVHSSAFTVVPSTKLVLYGLKSSGTQIEGRIIDPPAVRFVDNGQGMKTADDNAGHLLRSELVPGYLGAPLADGTMLTASGSVAGSRLSGQTTASILTEDRQRITAYDSTGKPQWQSAGMRPTSKFLLDAPTLVSGNNVVTLKLTDPLGNSGTVTATVTK